MTWQSNEPQPWPQSAGVVMLEGEPGKDRDAVVARWLAERRAGDGPTWHLWCDRRDGGAWAGLGALIEGLCPALHAHAPDLLARHGRELCLVAPALQSEVGFVECLTDILDGEEKTRNYPADRAYRCLHGLIDLLSEWDELTDPGRWSIVCDRFDEANALVHRFFTELSRRRGLAVGLHLLVVVGPGRGEAIAAKFEPSSITATIRLTLARDPVCESREEMTRLALELESRVEVRSARDEELTRLIDTWRRSTSPERALRWEVIATSRYTHAGLYEASEPYAADIEAGLDRLFSEDLGLYLVAVNMLYFCYVPAGRADDARRIVQHALERLKDPAELARHYYLMAMLYGRFLQPNDQDRAEQYLARALAVIEQGDFADDERHFRTVFMWNGLALVRLRQGRVSEALELCRSGVARLNEHLNPERHRLHRSVLLFNIAQVHAQIGPNEDAIEYFSQAMEVDPNYSEYYNDRGAVYFKMGLLEHAERDYLQAIELSPPYAEVWTNLAQCYRAMQRMDDAVSAYSRALDLDPSSALALVGRADAQFELDRAELALADYDRALMIEPEQPVVLASRAILHYEAGRLPEAVNDLGAALELAPDLAEVYQNRAVALRELGQRDEAARDLSTYLELCPDAEDRSEVEATLSALAGQR
jgi:tetratricopeptide (TPR) repeat protein